MRFLNDELRKEAFEGFDDIRREITNMSAIVQNKVPIESEDANKLFKEMLDVKEHITKVVSLVVNGYKDAKEVNKLSMEDLGEELCKYCSCTDYGDSSVGTSPYNMCEGCNCDQAYDTYFESEEEE